MSVRLHQWIRELYLAAAGSGGTPDSSRDARQLLARIAEQVPHASAEWRIADGRGAVVSQCESGSRGADRGTPQQLSERQVSFAVNGTDGLSHRFTFQREIGANAFAHDERATLEVLVEHLIGAEALLRRFPVQAGGTGSDGILGIALLDTGTRLASADTQFTRLIREADPDWDGRQLPFPLPETVDPERPGFVWRGLWIAVAQSASGTELRARHDRRAVRLSEREQIIARRVAEGFTFREIGADLGVAPSTVSTHLYNLYAKLGIRRRAELVAWLRQHAPRGLGV